jgi:hypothetical protein
MKRFIILVVLMCLFVPIYSYGQNHKTSSKYQGTISGEWSGTVKIAHVDGTLSMTISANGSVSGTFSGLQSGTIIGTVSPSGELNANKSPDINLIGQLSVEGGRLVGSGTWEGFGGTGSWNSK